MPDLNIAVVGLGFMGTTHIRAWRAVPGTRIAAVCDAVRLPVDGDLSFGGGNLGPAEPLRLDMSVVKATKRIEDLLADPAIDVVDLCVPTAVHPELAIAALQAGKHVICEKPLARTSAMARRIVEAARSAKGFFMPAMCLRFWPHYAWVKQAVDGGRLGRVLAARFRRVGEPPGWSPEFLDGARSGGALLDLHIHDADFVQFCFGRPRAVFATGFTLLSGAIDYVSAIYQVAGGASVTAEGSWLMAEGHGFNMAYTFIFERATVDYDMARGAEALRLFEKGQKPQTISLDGPDGYVNELSHMAESIRAGRPPSIVTGNDGLAAVEICEAEEESIRTGQIVKL
jgi:predicted dehydrogenase